jgi:lactoylglutathione lyase
MEKAFLERELFGVMALSAIPLGMPVKRQFVTPLKARRSAEFIHEAEDLVVFSPRLYKRLPTISRKDRGNMFTKIGTITIGVSDQDKALDFYMNKLGFEKVDDQPMSETERWLEIALPGTQTHIMLGLRGQSGGDKTGMTGFVLHTDNIEETCAMLKARGVTLTQELGTEPWGKWAQLTDLDNNEFGIWAPAW